MTAEQFWQSLSEETKYKWAAEVRPNWAFPFAEAYHRAESAAQLAEKEREIAKTLLTAQLWKGAAEQAEQRLQEAQARYAKLVKALDAADCKPKCDSYGHEDDCANAVTANQVVELSERLRQREAELEQLRAPRIIGIDLANGPDKQAYFCTSCGASLTPCEHYDAGAIPAPPKEANDE